MADWDRQFEIHAPSDITQLHRKVRPVASNGLVAPGGTSPVPLIDGEFVTLNSDFKFTRPADGTVLSWAWMEDRGDYAIQGYKRGAALFLGNYEASTLVYDTDTYTLGQALEVGLHTEARFGGVARSALGAQSTGITIARVIRLPAANGGKLRFVTVAY